MFFFSCLHLFHALKIIPVIHPLLYLPRNLACTITRRKDMDWSSPTKIWLRLPKSNFQMSKRELPESHYFYEEKEAKRRQKHKKTARNQYSFHEVCILCCGLGAGCSVEWRDRKVDNVVKRWTLQQKGFYFFVKFVLKRGKDIFESDKRRNETVKDGF